MADNPFSVNVVNPMQALLLGQKAYGDAQAQQKEQALTDARQTAVQAYQSGDAKTALSTLLGVGDTQGASALGNVIQQDWTRQHTTQQDALSQQHWGADFGLKKRAADRADDPTPAGFQKGPGGTYEPLPGGPQDPAYQARVAKESALAKGEVPTIIGAGSSVIRPNYAGTEGALFSNRFTGSSLSDDARDMKARQLINGDMSGLQNIGRGAQAGQTLEAISNRAAEMLHEQGMSSEQAAAHLGRQVQAFKASGLGQGAEARTAGVREANLNLILRAADAAIPAALEQSDKVSRTGWVPLNKIIQGGQVATSDPELKKFAIANLQLAEHFARAMNPTGVMRESDRDMALHVLTTADSKDTYRAAVMQIKKQITRERDAVRGAPVTPSAPSFRSGDVVNDPSQGNLTGPANVTSSGIKWSVQ